MKATKQYTSITLVDEIPKPLFRNGHGGRLSPQIAEIIELALANPGKFVKLEGKNSIPNIRQHGLEITERRQADGNYHYYVRKVVDSSAAFEALERVVANDSEVTS